MNAVTWVSVAALGISVLTFVATQLSQKKSSGSSYVERLEKQVEALEKTVTRLETRVRLLEDENIGLMRKLLEQPRPDKP